MEPVQSKDMAGANPPASPLAKNHDDLDILDGCERTLKIGGVTVRKKAFNNKEFSRFGLCLTFIGFATCETPEEVDSCDLDEIYTNCVLNAPSVVDTLQTIHFEEFLYSLMEFEQGFEAPTFAQISDDEFRAFFKILVEQNNLLKYAKKNVKFKLKSLPQR